MTDLQAAIGICQLQRLPDFIGRRRKLAAGYRQALADLPIQLPRAGDGHIFFRYVIDTGQEVSPVIEAMRRRGVTGARPVYKPLHHYLNQSGYPGAERAWQAALSIPLYPALSDPAADVVCSVLIDCFEGD
jgi:dTDP-4-amino-4,6-dideoxygalactose transaminase